MKRGLSLVLCLVATATGCLAEEGTTIQIQGALLHTGCAFDANSRTFVAGGIYDPFGNGVLRPRGFVLGLLVQNNLTPTTFYKADVYSENVRPSANSVAVFGFETCFVHVRGAAERGTFQGNCDDVSDTVRTFVASSVTVEPTDAGGKAPVPVEVLTLTHLQQIFGAKFSPADIPVRGWVNESVDGHDWDGDGLQTTDVYFYGPEDPAGGQRDESWGTYPNQSDTLVLVRTRAIGKTQSGRSVQSNWFSFPITVCMGCMIDMCGPVWSVPCPAPPPVSGIAGHEPTWDASVCWPYQEGPTSCDDVISGCT